MRKSSKITPKKVHMKSKKQFKIKKKSKKKSKGRKGDNWDEDEDDKGPCMKCLRTTVMSLFILLLVMIIVAATQIEEDVNMDYVLGMPTDESFIDYETLNKDIFEFQNNIRYVPQQFTMKLILEKEQFQGLILRRPGEIPLLTKEGATAYDEAIDFLNRQPSVNKLKLQEGMSKACQDHIDDIGQSGNITHTSTDGLLNPWDRVNKYGKWDENIAENLIFGPSHAEDIIYGFIVDDGTQNRGHRDMLFSRKWTVTGIATGSHIYYNHMTCIVYSEGFTGKSQEELDAQSATEESTTADSTTTETTDATGDSTTETTDTTGDSTTETTTDESTTTTETGADDSS